MTNFTEYMEINGITYKRKAVVTTVPARTRTKAAAMMEVMALMNKMSVSHKSTNKTAGINIVKEFELIEQKKSKLPRATRDAVVRKFNSFYEKVD